MNPPSNKNSKARDRYIAQKLRERRIEMGLNQSDLSNSLGITPQQVYKYEQGIDRISASRLYDFSRLLSVPLTYFFKEMEKKSSSPVAKELVVTCANLQRKRVRLKFLKLKAILTDIKTQEDYEIEIS